MLLPSHLEGRWVTGNGAGTALTDPVTGQEIARVRGEGLDLAAAFAYARDRGGPALRAMGYAERGRLLGAIAARLGASRDVWYRTALVNSGHTRADAAMDIEGAIQTLRYYAGLGESLGDARLAVEPGGDRLTRDPSFQAIHLWTPVNGVAVHINAFNFPAWGLWGKAAVALLAGVPVLAKPAVSTAFLAWEMVRDVAGLLPPGAMSLYLGGGQGLLDAITGEDVVSFTGSAETARGLRAHPRVLDENPRFNVEADSVNASILGPDVGRDDPLFDVFAAEMTREIVLKAGQKCTTARRLLVPRPMADAVGEAIAARLGTIVMGNPRRAEVGLGPVVTKRQQGTVLDSIGRLATAARVVHRGDAAPLDADPDAASFVPPHLLRCDDAGASAVNEVEAFGPCSTIIPYDDADDAMRIARRGGGSLVCSLFGNDAEVALDAARALAPSHGRLLLVDEAVASSHTDHSIVMPQCLHGGPGRAGGGEEMGGLRGLRLYHQRTALQTSAERIAAIRRSAVELRL